MESAPRDGTEVELLLRHMNFRLCKTDEERSEWEQVVRAKWIDFNGGGWTWYGMAGSAVGWRPLPANSIRTPLAVGNVYRFRGYKNNGFRVTAMSLPGTPSDDGGLPGVAVQWLNTPRVRGWYPVCSEAEFWECPLFSNACDPEYA